MTPQQGNATDFSKELSVKIRYLDGIATAGPWKDECRAVYLENGDVVAVLNLAMSDKLASANSEFIAQSRTLLPKALAYIEELEADKKRLNDVIRGLDVHAERYIEANHHFVKLNGELEAEKALHVKMILDKQCNDALLQDKYLRLSQLVNDHHEEPGCLVCMEFSKEEALEKIGKVDGK